MGAGNYPIVIEQGSDFVRLITWRDDNDDPINLTNFTARMKGRTSKDDITTLFSLTTENGKIILGGAAGTILISMTARQTAALKFVTGVYDLELVSSTGFVTRVLEGVVTLSREVTR